MDYVVVTKNDRPTIIRCIQGIREQSNVDRIIVVASEKSSDGTKDIVRDMRLRGLIDDVVFENSGLAQARVLGIERVQTEYFVFVDADVILEKAWFEKMYEYMRKLQSQFRLGAMSGMVAENQAVWEAQRRFGRLVEIKARGYTHNTIVRTEVARSWVPAQTVNAYEDYLLTQHIIRQGYRWFYVPVVSKHEYSGSFFKAAEWGGAGARQTNYFGGVLGLTKYLVLRLYTGFKKSIRIRNPFFIWLDLVTILGTIKGYVGWMRFSHKPK